MEDRNIHDQHHTGGNTSDQYYPETPVSPRSAHLFQYEPGTTAALHSLSQFEPPITRAADCTGNIPKKLPSSNKKNLSIESGHVRHPAFFRALKHLASPLAPLVSITTGLPHPDFPRTLLAYHLLTWDQLDDIARHYHQVWPPVPETFGYPIQVPAWVGANSEFDLDIETKRRRLGRFMGLRGCESPVVDDSHSGSWQRHACEQETDEEMAERMEREWQAALRCARNQDSDEVLRRKTGGI
ncbi:conserved hypothetical protein [Paecilomyces variotii No. 5]|uniref:Uncharacterized protein n=1 Tax=Byssochlamys spectabilis (strain No. 5 / NBRC 109023) TaxID=1356009 RepID=V5FQ62_BYSSN|nr:conserved hypothetical protein [Paecilomyces variotii No. 5]